MEQNRENQIREIVDSAVSNLREAAEVNTIIGKPLVTMDGTTILPISQVSFAFFAGGGEYVQPPVKNAMQNQFAGGSGGGASLTPVGFLVIKQNDVKMINTLGQTSFDKLADVAKEIVIGLGKKQ